MERRGDQNSRDPEIKETVLLQRVLEYRQGQLESHVAALTDAVQGKDGVKEQLMILRILADQRHKAVLCIGKWVAGILATLFLGLCYWVITESWQTRDAVKHLLSRPPVVQQGK